MSKRDCSRRLWLARGVGGAAATLTAASYARVIGANDRVGVGFIGYGLIGKRHVIDFTEQPDVAAVAVADVHHGRKDEAVAFMGAPVRAFGDFRALLDLPDVDAVVVSTPDHWHALMTMMACAAEKDVYVEKPLTLFVREGAWMVQVAKRYSRIVQVGTQQRSGNHYRRARQLIKSGKIGQITSVRMAAARNIMPGYGSPPDGDPPKELDYNLWLGPAPLRQYNPNRAIYHFRWFWDYSGGQMTNLGQHSLDIVDWFLGVESLKAVSSAGGRFVLRDNGQTPDTLDAIFEMHGWTAAWSHREASEGEETVYPLTFYGTKGSLGISRSGFTVTADPLIPPANTVPQFTGAHPAGGPRRVDMTGPPKSRTEAIVDTSGDSRAQFKDHVRNFLDCIKTRNTPVSDLESGHRVASMCHLANISYRVGRKIRWNADQQTITGDREANDLLRRAYRKPWDAELRAIGVS